MLTQTAKIDNSTNLSIALADDGNTLSEVVVVGYKTTARVAYTNAVSSVSVDEIRNNKRNNKTKTFSPDQILAGQTMGLKIKSGSGQPGSTKSIRIRGTSSLNSKNEPLVILDGKPISKKQLQVLNPNDIKDITVLKDASATSIYGDREKNGVIVITSKSGKVEKIV
uniref:TonB-dependent receptor plug domain-containing protein n=1 Tax=Flavobacterium piscinae TaxID=2506424 RepID=UPI0037093F21